MKNRYFFSKIALKNIQKNKKIYFPYLLTCLLSISMFYIVSSLSFHEGIDVMVGADTVRYFLQMGIVIIALFSFIFLFYTNRFLMKRRIKEFGLLHVLGMEKRHVLKVIGYESFFIGVTSLVLGLFFGMLLDKAMYLCIGRMFKAPISLGFYISLKAVCLTIILFTILFLCIYIKSAWMIHKSHAIDLLHGEKVGEKEPKTKVLTTIIGFISLLSGYYIAFTTKNPLTAFGLFFIAVFLVIIGTYCLFSSGSIFILKLLRRKKSFYYQSQHFINISHMLYRMKQNAIGLANICILCTMVLVMLSSTISLWIGIEDMTYTRYPREISITQPYKDETHIKELNDMIQKVVTKHHQNYYNEMSYTYLAFTVFYDGQEFITDRSQANLTHLDNIENLFFICQDDYERLSHQNIELKDNEVLLYSSRNDFLQDKFQLFDREWTIKEKLSDFIENGQMVSHITSTHYIVVKDKESLYDIFTKQKESYGKNASLLQYYIGFDLNDSKTESTQIYEQLGKELVHGEKDFSMECRSVERNAFIGLYAGLLFLGIFLSVLFLMATLLIIYYKQMSEGYEDQKRFEIMQKVGMDTLMIKKSIYFQILTVFLLPPVVSGIHLFFAFPFIFKILEVLGLMNLSLYAICTLTCFIIFIFIYILMFLFTSKVYYSIVKWNF